MNFDSNNTLLSTKLRVGVAFMRVCIMGSSFLAITDISNNQYYNYNSAIQ